MRAHRLAMLALAVTVLPLLACGLSGASGPGIPPGTPATPAIFLPPEWTLTPAPPTPDVPAGWEEFSAGRVHLWLPERFDGGDMGVKLQSIIDTMKDLGPEYAESARLLEDNPDVFVLWAFDPVKGPSGYITNVNITKEDVPSGITLQDYMEASLNGLPSSMGVVDQGTTSVGALEAGKLVLSSDIRGLKGLSVIYSIKDGNRFWNVTYSTGADEFVQRSADWEQSIRSFELDG